MKSWYAIEDGKSVIEIQVESLEQLFDARDPKPFREKDLDDDAVEYIVSSAQEIGLGRLGRLRILCSEPINDEISVVITAAIREFFLYKAELCRRKIRQTFNIGFKSLLIGIIFLSFAILSSKLLSASNPVGFFDQFLKEGLLLIGWVSMWKPINIFLYDWWPLLDLKRIYVGLAVVQIELVKSSVKRTDNPYI